MLIDAEKMAFLIFKNTPKNAEELIAEYQNTSKFKKPGFVEKHKLNEVQRILFDDENTLPILECQRKYEKWVIERYDAMKEFVSNLLKLKAEYVRMANVYQQHIDESMPQLTSELVQKYVLLYAKLNKKEFTNLNYLYDVPVAPDDTSNEHLSLESGLSL